MREDIYHLNFCASSDHFFAQASTVSQAPYSSSCMHWESSRPSKRVASKSSPARVKVDNRVFLACHTTTRFVLSSLILIDGTPPSPFGYGDSVVHNYIYRLGTTSSTEYVLYLMRFCIKVMLVTIFYIFIMRRYAFLISPNYIFFLFLN